MPYFVFCAHDGAGGEDIRARCREEHRIRLRREEAGCRCVAGGPLMDDAGNRMIGTLLVFEAPDKEAVRCFMAQDPYILEGLFARTDIWAWNWGLGQPQKVE
jgi:uncharacterized protein